MTFKSILFDKVEDKSKLDDITMPDYFVDLNLDQVINTIVLRKQEYNLNPFFYLPLSDEASIRYRQDVFRDLESEKLAQFIRTFSEKMAIVRRYLNMIGKLYYKYHQEGWFLEAISAYCEAVRYLVDQIGDIELTSTGLLEFRDYITQYVQSSQFKLLLEEANSLHAKLKTIQYNIIARGNIVRVRKYESEIDYSYEVEKTFEKFKQGDVKNYRIDLKISSGMNHVEALILGCVAKLFPEIFAELDQFFAKYNGFIDDTIREFDREIQFYISYLDFVENIKQMGLKFCYPEVSSKSKAIQALAAFDIALANKESMDKNPIICNDFYLKGSERIIIVSGPNQGGKTTFARMFGQMHYLASLGVPIPGSEGHLFLFDQIFTHFEKEEDIRNLRGKLQDDLVRVHSILDKATGNSIIIMNEIFTSTSLRDAIFLSKKIMEKIIQLDCLCVCVSFIDELSTMDEKTVSMVSTILPNNPAVRTYKIIRKPADGLSYAISIAEKYRLTYDLIKERIKR